MRLVAALALFLAPAAYSQTAQRVQTLPTRVQSSYRALASQPNQAIVQSTDMIFPHIAMGGGWDTTLALVNITNVSITFNQYFYDEAGNDLTVTVQTPDGAVTSLSSMQTTLAPGGSARFTLISNSADTQVGWSGITYDSSAGRLGGYASFRLHVNGAVNEGLVPLSAYDDNWFMLPFDNTNGYVTALALVNPGSTLTDHVTITAFDESGNTIAGETITLNPGAHSAFVISGDDHMPQLAGRSGSLLVEADTTALSGLGIRMNSSLSFTSIPIMNF